MNWWLYSMTSALGYVAWFMTLVAGSFGTSDSTKAKVWFGLSIVAHQVVIMGAYIVGRLYTQ